MKNLHFTTEDLIRFKFKLEDFLKNNFLYVLIFLDLIFANNVLYKV